MDDPVVDIQNLTKAFTPGRPPALKGLTAKIPKGKITGVIGPDGAGKTTLLRLIAGLLKPTEGSVSVCNYDTIKDAEFVHFLTGYMPQRFGLYEDLTVIQNLNLYADLRGVTGQQRQEKFQQLLDFTGLKPFIDRLAKNLSGGMKQKLGLACALVKKPTLLVLDEPSVGVDPISRRELWKMIYDLVAEEITILWSTVYLDEAEKCQSVLLLSEGNLMFSGDPKVLTEKEEGRTFKITDIGADRRKVLFEALEDPHVMDGIIQGRDVRIVLKEKPAMPPVIDAMHIIPTPPRFEDGFIDILGGGPGGRSVLAEMAPEVKGPSETVIAAQGLTKKFGSFVAASHISFEVKKGEIFGLLGPNGAGKSTTFKMLCGLLTPTEGKAFVNGVDLQVAPGVARSHIGYMSQKFSLYGTLSTLQNLEFFAGIYNLKPAERKEAIEEMVEIFNLKPFIKMSADELSLGYKQRLALACANMHHPEVLFLDEPTSGVDPITRREFWNHINGLVRKGVTIMVTTHFMEEAEYCDRIALIYQGRIINMNSPNALKDEIKSNENANPTLEDVFVETVKNYDRKNSL